MKIWDDEWNLIMIVENLWGQVKQLVEGEVQFTVSNPKKEKISN